MSDQVALLLSFGVGIVMGFSLAARARRMVLESGEMVVDDIVIRLDPSCQIDGRPARLENGEIVLEQQVSKWPQ